LVQKPGNGPRLWKTEQKCTKQGKTQPEPQIEPGGKPAAIDSNGCFSAECSTHSIKVFLAHWQDRLLN
jgi:hypothetical protein